MSIRDPELHKTGREPEYEALHRRSPQPHWPATPPRGANLPGPAHESLRQVADRTSPEHRGIQAEREAGVSEIAPLGPGGEVAPSSPSVPESGVEERRRS